MAPAFGTQNKTFGRSVSDALIKGVEKKKRKKREKKDRENQAKKRL